MTVQLISYDLRVPNGDYTGLFEELKALGKSWHCLESVWLVQTGFSCKQIRDRLSRHLRANDKLLVAPMAGGWSTWGLSDECNKWLQDNL
jgi:hypothetical protein